jgi:hypothetical protein
LSAVSKKEAKIISTKTYKFREQLDIGQQGEAKLDDYFSSHGYEVREVDLADQKRGIDRVLVNKKTGKEITIEYKSDSLTHKTGNVFVETISNNQTGALGWALKGQADFVVYYAIGYEEAIVVRSSRFRENIAEWIFKYPARPCKNPGYKSFGLLVPWPEVKAKADKVIAL